MSKILEAGVEDLGNKQSCSDCCEIYEASEMDLFEAELMDFDGQIIDVFICKDCQKRLISVGWVFDHGGECKVCHRPEMTELNDNNCCSECFEARINNN